MKNYFVKPIGKIRVNEENMYVQLEPEYIPALQGLSGFSHLNLIWWFSELDNEEYRKVLEVPKPYKSAPDVMGIFATRSPIRPNPIALTAVRILNIDYTQGIIYVDYIDANDKTPLIDIKPYTPSYDIIENPESPSWCRHWPISREKSGEFNWENEFNF